MGGQKPPLFFAYISVAGQTGKLVFRVVTNHNVRRGSRMRQVALVAIFALAAISGWARSPQKKRVAVFDFDNAAIQGGLRSPFLETTTPDVGKAAANILITKLVQDGSVTVIERNAIDKLLTEQNFSNTDRTDPITAAKLGRILGVDAIILGTITHYDYA